MNPVPTPPVDGHPLAWARRLRMRELEGARLTLVQRAAWRAALGQVQAKTETTIGEFDPVPADALPPAMRPEVVA